MGWEIALKLAFFMIWPVFLILLVYFWKNRKSNNSKTDKELR